MTTTRTDRWLLAHHTGSLGDTIITIPALRAVRAEWPDHRVALLTTAGNAGISARHLLDGDVLVDEFVEYNHSGSAIRLLRDLWRVAGTIRRLRIELAVSLLPIERPLRPRDGRFLRACGVRDLRGYDPVPSPADPVEVPPIREDLMKLSRLAAAGVAAARSTHAQMPLLTLSAQEQAAAEALLTACAPGRPKLAMGFVSNWSSKNWPLERFVEVGRRAHGLGAEIVGVGGPGDRATFDALAAQWGFGVNLCGQPPRVAAAALARCQAFVGVDSGPAHLAASVGTPCVVASWAGSMRGQWAPIGPGHVVVRLSVPCEGCRSVDCHTPGHPCIEQLSVDMVWAPLKPLLTAGRPPV
jgi:ADP-heptose:LPS heptosyltransferase